MARYIDVEKIKLTANTMVDDSGEVYVALSDVRKAIALAPTADVAPRAEVKELQAECNKWQERLKTECEYTEAITKKRVVREIFKEIDNMFIDFVSLFHDNISKATIEQNKDKQQVNSVALSVINTARTCLAELEKKYTEGRK